MVRLSLYQVMVRLRLNGEAQSFQTEPPREAHLLSPAAFGATPAGVDGQVMRYGATPVAGYELWTHACDRKPF